MTDDPRTANPWYEREITAWRERAETAEAENERHRRANLVRAVTEGFNAWIVEAVNAEEWDRVPWSVAMILKNENRRLRDALRDAADALDESITKLGREGKAALVARLRKESQ